MLGWFRSPVTPPEFPEWDDDVLSEVLSKERVGNVRFLAFLNISYPLVLLDHVKNQYTYQPLSWHDLTDKSWELESWQSLWIGHSFLRCPDRFADWTDSPIGQIAERKKFQDTRQCLQYCTAYPKTEADGSYMIQSPLGGIIFSIYSYLPLDKDWNLDIMDPPKFRGSRWTSNILRESKLSKLYWHWHIEPHSAAQTALQPCSPRASSFLLRSEDHVQPRQQRSTSTSCSSKSHVLHSTSQDEYLWESELCHNTAQQASLDGIGAKVCKNQRYQRNVRKEH